jgi:hypothetical protein
MPLEVGLGEAILGVGDSIRSKRLRLAAAVGAGRGVSRLDLLASPFSIAFVRLDLRPVGSESSCSSLSSPEARCFGDRGFASSEASLSLLSPAGWGVVEEIRPNMF